MNSNITNKFFFIFFFLALHGNGICKINSSTRDTSYIQFYKKGRQLEKQSKLDSALWNYYKAVHIIHNQIFSCAPGFEFNSQSKHDNETQYLCEQYAIYYNRIFWLQVDLGKYKETLYKMDSICKNIKKCMDTATTYLADFDNIYGNIYRFMGDYEKSLYFYTKALSIFNKLPLPADSLRSSEINFSVAACHNNLGVLFRAKGNYDLAIQQYSLALNYKQRASQLGMQNVNFSSTYNNLGNVYMDKGDYDYALVYYQQAHSLKVKLFGEKHYETITTLNNIGIIYWYKHEYTDALNFFLISSTILDNTLPGHPYTAAAYNNIGMLYFDLKDYSKGKEYTEKSLNIRLKKFGNQHPYLAESYNNLANFYLKDEDYFNAKKYNFYALDIMKHNFGDKNPSVGKIFCSIANIYKEEVKFDSSLLMYQYSFNAIVENFQQNNIYKNPIIISKDKYYNYSNKNILDEAKLLEALVGKAETLFLKE